MKYILPTIYILFMLWIFWKIRPIKKCPHCGAKKYTKDKNGNEICNFEWVGVYKDKQKCKVCDNYLN